jgi:gas vesicle protein
MGQGNNLSKGLLIGFLTGSIVGAAVALLYAPKSGKELRQDIKVKADDFKDEAEKFVENAKEKAKATINEGKKKAETLLTDAKAKAEALLNDANRVITDAKSKVSDKEANA